MYKYLLVFVCSLVALSVRAEEQQISTEKQTDLSVAIYNENLALVNDVRTIELKKGLNEIAFLGVSALIKPETALIKGNGFFVKEQNFNFDLLSYSSMLEKSVGQKVMLEYINPGNGNKIVEYGELLSTANGSVVLKIGDRIETNYPGRVVFLSIPKSLRAEPTLVLSLDAEKTVKEQAGLNYLTEGLSWKADYVAELNADETAMSVNGMITLTNTSGVGYEKANMQVVAGNVNQVKPMMYESARNDVMFAKSVSAYGGSAGAQREEFMDYHLYSIPGKVNIENNQTKQVSLLSGNAKVKKDYIYNNLFSIYYDKNSVQKFEKVNPKIELVFDNNDKDGLGVPLPAGIIRVYKSDSKGQTLFAGEDNISHTAKNEEVKINLGEAFDITAEGKKTSFKSYGTKKFAAEYEVIFKNPKDEDVEIKFYQRLPNAGKIINENVKSLQENANEILWVIKVPKNKESKLTFTVMVDDE